MSVPYPPNAFQTNPYQPQQKVRFEWISESWQLFTASAGTWVGAILIAGVIGYAVSFAGSAALGVNAGLMQRASSGVAPNPYAVFLMPGYYVVLLVSVVLNAFLLAGLLRMANAQVRREPVDIGMLFSGGPYFLPMLLFQFLLGIADSIATLLLVLPVFVAVGMLAPSMALIADGVPLGQAVSRSIDGMKKDWLMAGVFVFVFALVILVSFIPCGLGALATYPMALIVLSLIYRDMIGMPLGNAAPVDANIYGAAQPGVWPPSPSSQPPYGSPTPNPYAPQPPMQSQPPVQPQPPAQSAMPPFYQTPLAGAPESRNPDEPEIGGENGPGTLPQAPPSSPNA